MATGTTTDHFWPDTMRLVLRGYVHYIPAILLLWVLVEIAAPQVPNAPWVGQVGLFILFAEFYFGAATRAAGITDENAFRSTFARVGISLEPLMMIFLLSIIAATCFLIVVLQDNTIVDIIAIVVTTVLVSYAFARTWPVWAVPFFFVGKLVWSSDFFWRGPGMELALRLTREQGLLNRHTLRFMLAAAVVFGLFSYLRFHLDMQGLSQVVLYIIGMPILGMVAVRGTASLLTLSKIESDYLL